MLSDRQADADGHTDSPIHVKCREWARPQAGGALAVGRSGGRGGGPLTASSLPVLSQVIEGLILEKPVDRQDAYSMLSRWAPWGPSQCQAEPRA